ncbi:MAG: Ger(x)C family spore germination protein [Firmicutes bacterium]|nr:Ger(x)C family spore germination protein [Bacillota bacterium]
MIIEPARPRVTRIHAARKIQKFAPQIFAHSLKNRLFPTIVCFVLIFAASGCWDQIEINQRAFILGMGIDTIPAGELKPAQVRESGILEEQSDQLLVTMEIPKTAELISNQGQAVAGPGSAAGLKKPAWVPAITGVSLAQVVAEIRLRANRQAFLGHLRLVAVGEEFARRQGIRKILDFFARNPEIQLGVAFFIVNGRAQDLLTLIPPDEKYSAIYLNNISNIDKFSARLFYRSVGELAIDLYEDGNALAGRVRPASGEAVSGGMAVINNWKLAGFLGEVETMGVNLFLGRMGQEMILINMNPGPGAGGSWFGVRVYNTGQKVKPRWNGRQLQLDYSFNTEGEIVEAPYGQQISKNKTAMRRLEKLVARQLTAAAQAALTKLQQDYKSDAIGFGVYIRKHWPQIWKKIGPRWREEFPYVKVTVKSQFKLRRMGISL